MSVLCGDEDDVSDTNLSDTVNDLEEFLENEDRPTEKTLAEEKFPAISSEVEEFLEDPGTPEERLVIDEADEVADNTNGGLGTVTTCSKKKSLKVNLIVDILTILLLYRLLLKPSTPSRLGGHRRQLTLKAWNVKRCYGHNFIYMQPLFI